MDFKAIYRVWLFLLTLLPMGALAQYDFNSGQIIKTIEFYNPGYNAMKDYTSAIILYRSPFFNNQALVSPNYENDLSYTTRAINLYHPFIASKTGISFNMISEKIGYRENIVTDLAFDVVVRSSNKSYISLGIAGGANIWQYNLSNALHNYGAIDLGEHNRIFPYMSVGINFFKRGYHFGASYHATSPNSDLSLSYNPFAEDEINSLYQTLYVNTSFQIALTNKMHLKPFIIFKNRNFTPKNYLIEGGVNMLISDRIWLGAAYRESWVSDAYTVMADLKIVDYLRLGYSFEQNLNLVGFLTNSIHEIRLQFILPHKIKDPYVALNNNQ
jgi:type IX secretion system PorP/SprF family membrane protein